jgi:hypothetical protein
MTLVKEKNWREYNHTENLVDYRNGTWIPLFLLIIFLLNRVGDLLVFKVFLYILIFFQLKRFFRTFYHLVKLTSLFLKCTKLSIEPRAMPRVGRIYVFYFIDLVFYLFLFYNFFKDNFFWFIFLFVVCFIWDIVFSIACENHLMGDEDSCDWAIKFNEQLEGAGRQSISENEWEKLERESEKHVKYENGHAVMKIICNKCGYSGVATVGSADFKCLGKDNSGNLYFECSKCKKHIKFNPIKGCVTNQKKWFELVINFFIWAAILLAVFWHPVYSQKNIDNKIIIDQKQVVDTSVLAEPKNDDFVIASTSQMLCKVGSFTEPLDNEIEYGQEIIKDKFVHYLRRAINDFLNDDYIDSEFCNGSFGLYNGKHCADSAYDSNPILSYDNNFLRGKFIVLEADVAFGGGESIILMFKDKPDQLFYAWVYSDSDDYYDLRDFSEYSYDAENSISPAEAQKIFINQLCSEEFGF